jgi:predicted TIM-barrel fold metal-dependent hydrolase
MPVALINDAHCHFFSPGFFRTLGKALPDLTGDAAVDVPARLEWDAPVSNEALADRWAAELDRHGVNRAMVIASVHGDDASVSAAVARQPNRLVGAFMFNPLAPDAAARLERALADPMLRTVCLFPAMTECAIGDSASVRVFEAVAKAARSAPSVSRGVFAHCGVLSIGIRKKLGLASLFDLSLGDPLAVAAVASRFPDVTVIIPHFGAGRLDDALEAAKRASNIHLDTSSSNSWIASTPGLTLGGVFARVLDAIGPDRLLFGTDSSFFPRGWQKPVYEAQKQALDSIGADAETQAKIFSGNFDRLFTYR